MNFFSFGNIIVAIDKIIKFINSPQTLLHFNLSPLEPQTSSILRETGLDPRGPVSHPSKRAVNLPAFAPATTM